MQTPCHTLVNTMTVNTPETQTHFYKIIDKQAHTHTHTQTL